MQIQNKEILKIIQNIKENFLQNEYCIPIKLDFPLQNNIVLLAQAATKIENYRTSICKKYGTLNKEKTEYLFLSPENVKNANEEFEILLNLKQDLNFQKVQLADIEDLNLTIKQIQSILFMIEE